MRILYLLIGIISLVTGAAAQGDIEAVLPQVEDRQAELATYASEIESQDADLIALQEQVRDLRRQAEDAQLLLQYKVDQLKADIERLGPAPAEGETEAEAIAEERERLNAELRQYDAAWRQTSLNIAETQRLLTEIANLRRDAFLGDLFFRTASPLSSSLWASAFSQVGELNAGWNAVIGNFFEKVTAEGSRTNLALTFGAALALALFLWGPVRQRLHRMIQKRISTLEPLESRKVLVAAAHTAAGVLPVVLGGYVLLEALRAIGIITPDGVPLSRTIWAVFVSFFVVASTASAVFSPRNPAWRILPLESGQAKQVLWLFLTAVFLIGMERIIVQEVEMFGPAEDLMLLLNAIGAILLAFVLLLLARHSLWTAPAENEEPGEDESGVRILTGAQIRILAGLAALTAIVAVLSGYIRFGHFLTTRIFYLLVLAGAIWTVRALLRELIRVFDRRFSQHRTEQGEASEQMAYYWISITVDILAFLVFIPPALLILGAAWADVSGIIVDAFTGFNIGNVRISLAKILGAVALVALIIYGTRIIQSMAEARIFKATRMDAGVRNSLKTLIGYVGLIIAFMVGIGSLGFDLSNLAIIAGALSVGIGFGLQSIVNNFVSGLILLFERPIKVGDWVVTSSGEGTVERISVRSTEIKTFDRSSIIVPNADLISNAVTNWTHKDKIGRLTIPVGISYSLDPEIAIKLLEEVAAECKDIMKYPAAYVYFADFGDSSLNLQLRCYIRNVEQTLTVRTKLRVAIWKKFHENDVEIPFPQRDLHLRSGWPVPGQSDFPEAATPAAGEASAGVTLPPHSDPE